MKRVSNNNNNNNNNNKKEKGIRNIVDVSAIAILCSLSKNSKTSAEMVTELREIPKASIYRKIKKLEHSELIRKVTSTRRKPKPNNTVYEITSRKFAMYYKGTPVRITI